MKPRHAVILAVVICCRPIYAKPITILEHKKIMHIADMVGIPRSIANRLQIEESGDPILGEWGNPCAVGPLTPEGYRALGLIQLYNKPSNMEWLLLNYWYPWHKETFDVFNPLHNAEVGYRYLHALHKRFLTWERALWYYNCGYVINVPSDTKKFARRIIEAPDPEDKTYSWDLLKR